MKLNLYASKMLAIILVLLFQSVLTQVNGQDAKIKRATAETSASLVFSVWVMRQNIKSGQDIVIYYRVDNHSPKTIYLVRDNTSKTVIEDDTIIFPSPIVSVGGDENFDYSYTKVTHGSSYRGQLKVSKAEYKEAQSWRINVGFGYVTDITGLNPRPEQITDYLPFKSLLAARIQILLLSSLIVKVVEP